MRTPYAGEWPNNLAYELLSMNGINELPDGEPPASNDIHTLADVMYLLNECEPYGLLSIRGLGDAIRQQLLDFAASIPNGTVPQQKAQNTN